MGARLEQRLFIFLTCIFSCFSSFFFNTPVTKLYSGILQPEDPDVCSTQNVTFTCTLRSPSAPLPNHFIGFAVKNESTNTQFVPVAEDRVRVINNLSSEFTIYNVNATTYFYVKCFYWEDFGDLDNNKQLGDIMTASMYPMPEEVQDFNCIVENYVYSMNCTWNYGKAYEGKFAPDLTFQWRIPTYSGSWNNCSDLSREYGYCFWNSSRAGDFTMKKIEIQLTVEEPCGVNVTSNFFVDTTKIVKPNPVIGLNSYVLNSTCIRTEWRTSSSHIEYPKEHRVIVSNKWEEPKVYKFNTTEQTENETHKMLFCDLHPYTKYTFDVSIQPTGNQAGYYSNRMETVAKTYSDIPSASPVMTKGGFSYSSRECEGQNSRRDVCVFWKPIKEEDKNGEMKGLEYTCTANDNAKTTVGGSWAEDLTFGCISDLMCNTTYVFSIKARNNNGSSKNGSTLVISAATSDIHQPQFIVEAANASGVLVTWTGTVKANSFLVAWCRNENGKCENKNNVHWQTILPDKRETVIPINSKNSPQDFLYGVSVLTDEGSSGLEWQDCVYLKYAEPKREPMNVVVSTGSEDNTLVVTWDKLTCKSDEPYIAEYNVQYNKLHDTQQFAVNVTAAEQARVVLRSLEEGEKYIVTVRGITQTGVHGPPSEPLTGVPKHFSLKLGQIVGIGIGVSTVLLFAAAVIARWTRIKCKKVVKDNDGILVEQPDEMLQNQITDTITKTGNDRKSVTSIERQNSCDSGDSGYMNGTLTPPIDNSLVSPSFDNSKLVNTQSTLEQPKEHNTPQLRPDGYCVATADNTERSDVNTSAVQQELHTSDVHMTNRFVPREPTEARVGVVIDVTNRVGHETFIKTIKGKETSSIIEEKTRVKNVSGDSCVSETYAKATLDRQEENVNNDNCGGVDGNICNSKEPDYVKGNNTDFSLENENTTRSSFNIPKPKAFECSDSKNSFSATNLGSTSTPDYIQAHSNDTQFSPDYSEYQTVSSTNTRNSLENFNGQFKAELNTSTDDQNSSKQTLLKCTIPEQHDSLGSELSISSSQLQPVETTTSEYVTANGTPNLDEQNPLKSTSQQEAKAGTVNITLTNTVSNNLGTHAPGVDQVSITQHHKTSSAPTVTTGGYVTASCADQDLQHLTPSSMTVPTAGSVPISEPASSASITVTTAGYVPIGAVQDVQPVSSAPLVPTADDYVPISTYVQVQKLASSASTTASPAGHNSISSANQVPQPASSAPFIVQTGGYVPVSSANQVPQPACSAPVTVPTGGYVPVSSANQVQQPASPAPVTVPTGGYVPVSSANQVPQPASSAPVTVPTGGYVPVSSANQVPQPASSAPFTVLTGGYVPVSSANQVTQPASPAPITDTTGGYVPVSGANQVLQPGSYASITVTTGGYVPVSSAL